MTDFDAIDALLAEAKQEVPLPPAEERRALREELNVSRTQLAKVLDVSASTVGGWESGREPSGEVREKYAYFLEGARTKLTAAGSADQVDPVDDVADGEVEAGLDDVDVLSEPRPCVLCGRPARHQVEGFPQHLDAADCAGGDPARPVPSAPEGAPSGPAAATARGVKVVPVGRRVQPADPPDLIASAVAAALDQHSGDVEAATAALVKRAIPDAMALLDHSRKGGRYDVVAHPWLPDILRKQTARGADQIWEARPKWTRPELPPGEHEVTALDVNGAYLSALKTHLPLGQLEHSTGGDHDRRRAGVHLITPPGWDHDAYLPNPLGSRDEPGPVWVTEPSLRLLLRLSGPKYGLCDPPEIHESWTSGATENLLEKFRIALKDARDRAIAEDDEVTLEYVKAMYSKFVSTMGESNYNRELYRADWMHLIRSQAFVNLWWKAHRAYDEGLTVVRAMGTDELHVAGDWRAVFAEGRGVTEVKVKDVYAVGTEPSNGSG
ncbi:MULTISPECIES: helix-turn-helix domain-containing protein [Streptomyces]|uniref:Dihydrolipoamide S-succinyltransferase n=1 Tax=Streptomyces sviceus (strain ATCC 29083 / DSM 924 / JCM 4929 / NBRC 13980 / NCIMB 11184 / NRRL 5439 / UC 5370) TaxID=463191 RepID=B5I7M7_STRX2|nr:MULTISPECIES: helix-turn-helix domain-containing protein [Streptomyces]EDY61082.1 dihydrolipoamide S-succinyltransferase [Streptomyces sviceus ATCC 29083]MYT03557.1 helix-turn-helix domain-containing protein [Streptomyces sp. SID5470]